MHKKVTTHSERMAALDACTGKYDFNLPDEEPQVFHIHRNGSQLCLHIEGYTSVELKRTGNDEFKTDDLHYCLLFNRKADGSVDDMTVYSISKFREMSPVVAPKV